MIEEQTEDGVDQGIELIEDDELAGILQTEIDNAEDRDDDFNDNTLALDYYYGRRPAPPEEDGLSGVISMDVADMVEATLSQIMPCFVSSDMAKFMPTSEQDEEPAQIESDVVNYTFKKNNGYNVLYLAIKDGLLQRNGVIKTTWSVESKVKIQEFKGLTPIELQQVIQGGEVINHSQDVTDDGFGNPMIISDVTIKYIDLKQGIECCAVPPEEFLYSSEQPSLFLDDCRFMAHRTTNETESSLIAKGFDPDQVRDLPTYRGYSWNDEEVARNRNDEQTYYDTIAQASRLIEIYECYMLVDRDGDGIAERRKIMYSGSEILRYADGSLADEYYEGVPFAAGTPFMMPHKFKGLSMYDKQKQVSDIKTALTRQGIDNGYAANNQILEFDINHINPDDMVNSKPSRIPSTKIGSINQIPVTPVASANLQWLEYMDKVRRERGGAALDMGSENLSVGQNTAHGTERVMSSLEMLGAMITRSFADTMLKPVFIEIHRLLRKYGTEEISYQKSNGWESTVPAQWSERDTVTVHTGLSKGEQGRLYQTYQSLLDRQIQALEMNGDGIIVDLDRIHNTLTAIARTGGIDDPSLFWIDPRSPDSLQAKQSQQQQQQQESEEMKALQQQLAQAQSDLAIAEQQKAQATADNNMMKSQVDLLKAGSAEQFNYDKLSADIAMKLTELQVNSGQPVGEIALDNEDVAEDITEADDREDKAGE